MSIDGLTILVEDARAGGGSAPIIVPYDTLEARTGLNLDLDATKLAVKEWADQNGYEFTADPAKRELILTQK